ADALAPRDRRFRHVTFVDTPHRRRQVADLSVPLLRREDRREGSPISGAGTEFIRWLFGQVGLDIDRYRPDTLARRLPACLRLLNAASPGDARHAIEARPALLEAAADTMLIGVTSFFRDPFVYALLAERVVPTLLAERGGIAVWSVGCSDGAELYSFAMLLDECGVLGKSYLAGTDCRLGAVRRARAGFFEAGTLGGLDPNRRRRYLAADGDRFRVCKELRQAVRWWVGDIFEVPQIGAWDLVVCRNLSIYLQAEAAELLWSRLGTTVRRGGVLVTGKAERPALAGFVQIAPCLHVRERPW
ncbi:MAG TPA: CheR family methyltransferase, partial [Gaiellaceae bacterium]|nr:CheR family methyltransferase [Gaiellaceae bacterium]